MLSCIVGPFDTGKSSQKRIDVCRRTEGRTRECVVNIKNVLDSRIENRIGLPESRRGIQLAIVFRSLPARMFLKHIDVGVPDHKCRYKI
jgi:hypothetical protein